MTGAPAEARQTIGWFTPIGLFLATFLIVAYTLSDYGITWDEPQYFHASDLHIEWLADLRNNLLEGKTSKSLDDQAIKSAWHWDFYHVPHPPFSRILSGLTKAVFFPYVDKISAYRLAPALFFAMLVIVMYLWVAEAFDRATGLFSALALLVIPNLFGFAHFAVTDLPLAAMWFLTAYCFWKGLQNWKWSLVLGLVWGLALSTKFPALLIPIPLLLWAHLHYRNAYANNIFAMVFLSPLVMIASQPYLWHQTSPRIIEFLYEGVSRGYRPETNFAVFFFNELYFTNTLPWYYPFFVLGVTVPETILILALIGAAFIPAFQNHRPVTTLFLMNALFIPATGLLPGAVLHDGPRQLLSSLPFFVGLASGGFFFTVQHLYKLSAKSELVDKIKHLRQKLSVVIFLIVLFPPAVDLVFYHPYELSYYNRLAGGIRGAYRRGLEVTYFMEVFTPDWLAYLNEKLPPNARINASVANFMFEYYKKAGRLRPDIKITDKKPFDYYILLNRRSVMSPSDRAMLNSGIAPQASVSIAGVPLVLLYKVSHSP